MTNVGHIMLQLLLEFLPNAGKVSFFISWCSHVLDRGSFSAHPPPPINTGSTL